MSLAKRIIPCLDVKEGKVVKGIKFEDLRHAGDPAKLAERYSKEGADELVFLDITASVESRSTRLDWVKRVGEKVSIPFVVGGGIRSLDDMEVLFDLSVDKVSISTAAVRNPSLIKEASDKFGKVRIIVAIDGKRSLEGNKPLLEVVIKGGKEATGLDVIDWAKKAEKLGAGEILLTSKDADGTKEGYDLEMTSAVAEAVGIPVIASGGAGSIEHIYEILTRGKAQAALVASILHFGNFTIKEIKEELRKKGVVVR